MYVTVFSVVMAVLWFSVAAVIYSLAIRKTGRGGLWFVFLLCGLCLIRIMVPIEIPPSGVINSYTVYPKIISVLQTRAWFLSVQQWLLVVWLFGIAVSGFFRIHELLSIIKLRNNAATADHDSRIYNIAAKAADDTGCSALPTVMLSDRISSAYLVGYFKPIILLSRKIEDYSDEEIYHIFRHELTHFMCGHMWAKAFLMFIRCVMWWDPAVYFLYNSVSHMQELMCDARVCKNMDDQTKLDYLGTILHILRDHADKKSMIPVGVTGISSDQAVEQRFNLVLEKSQSRLSRVKLIVGGIVAIVLFFASYKIIVQSAYMPDLDKIDGTGIYVDMSGDAFLLDNGDGTFSLSVGNGFRGILNEDEIKEPPYNQYRIYIKEVSNNYDE